MRKTDRIADAALASAQRGFAALDAGTASSTA